MEAAINKQRKFSKEQKKGLKDGETGNQKIKQTKENEANRKSIEQKRDAKRRDRRAARRADEDGIKNRPIQLFRKISKPRPQETQINQKTSKTGQSRDNRSKTIAPTHNVPEKVQNNAKNETPKKQQFPRMIKLQSIIQEKEQSKSKSRMSLVLNSGIANQINSKKAKIKNQGISLFKKNYDPNNTNTIKDSANELENLLKPVSIKKKRRKTFEDENSKNTKKFDFARLSKLSDHHSNQGDQNHTPYSRKSSNYAKSSKKPKNSKKSKIGSSSSNSSSNELEALGFIDKATPRMLRKRLTAFEKIQFFGDFGDIKQTPKHHPLGRQSTIKVPTISKKSSYRQLGFWNQDKSLNSEIHFPIRSVTPNLYTTLSKSKKAREVYNSNAKASFNPDFKEYLSKSQVKAFFKESAPSTIKKTKKAKERVTGETLGLFQFDLGPSDRKSGFSGFAKNEEKGDNLELDFSSDAEDDGKNKNQLFIEKVQASKTFRSKNTKKSNLRLFWRTGDGSSPGMTSKGSSPDYVKMNKVIDPSKFQKTLQNYYYIKKQLKPISRLSEGFGGLGGTPGTPLHRGIVSRITVGEESIRKGKKKAKKGWRKTAQKTSKNGFGRQRETSLGFDSYGSGRRAPFGSINGYSTRFQQNNVNSSIHFFGANEGSPSHKRSLMRPTDQGGVNERQNIVKKSPKSSKSPKSKFRFSRARIDRNTVPNKFKVQRNRRAVSMNSTSLKIMSKQDKNQIFSNTSKSPKNAKFRQKMQETGTIDYSEADMYSRVGPVKEYKLKVKKNLKNEKKWKYRLKPKKAPKVKNGVVQRAPKGLNQHVNQAYRTKYHQHSHFSEEAIFKDFDSLESKIWLHRIKKDMRQTGMPDFSPQNNQNSSFSKHLFHSILDLRFRNQVQKKLKHFPPDSMKAIYHMSRLGTLTNFAKSPKS